MSTRPYLGTNVSTASAEELLQRGILEEGEPLLALFDGMLLDERRRRIGGVAICDFVALTNKRLITWARGLFNDTVDSFLWQNVDVVKAETWDPWHGRVVLAFRLPVVASRTRRIAVRGTAAEQAPNERVIVNTFDYMPADDVTPLSNMIAWTGDQVVAGMTGEQLVAAFAEQFPAPERQAMASFFAPLAPEPAAPPPPPPPVEQPRRRWWQRAIDGSGDPPTASTGNLIADYESRRSSMPVGDGPPALPMSSKMPISSQMPIMSDQPSMYEVSRSLRLFLEAPRRLARGVRRASEMMGGAGDLMNGMQDPQVRRNAMFGLYQAAAQQEAENGPLASVGPVVRAVVRFAEPLPDSQPETVSQSQTHRVQVRAAVRRSAPTQAVESPAQAAPATSPAPATPAAGSPVRRSISVRRMEPAAEAAAPEAPAAAPQAPVVQRTPVPVRRLAINRDSQEPRSVSAGVSDDEL